MLVLECGFWYWKVGFGLGVWVLEREYLREVVLCAGATAAVCWVLDRRERLGGGRLPSQILDTLQ